MKDLFNASLLFVAGIGNTLVRGLVISMLWNWFVSTAFQVPHLGVISAVGISFLFGIFNSDLRFMLLRNDKTLSEDDNSTKWAMIVGELVGYGITIFAAFLWHLFL